MNVLDPSAALLSRARRLAAGGEDAQALQAYLTVLRAAPTHGAALMELAALAESCGHRAAARTCYAQVLSCDPSHAAARINLATLLLEEGDAPGARLHCQAALDAAPDLPQAHQGMARALAALGYEQEAAHHRERGFRGHAVVTLPCRGPGPGIPLLLLVSALGGNIPTRHWIDPNRFAVTAIHADYFDPGTALPAHALVLNAIGDADLCATALARAEAMLAGGTARVINPPARVRATGRAEVALRLAGLPGVVTPSIRLMPRAEILARGDLRFPLLLRSPGFHTGQHFVRVDAREALADAVTALPGGSLFVIDYLNARGADGMVRKYRVMMIGGVLYPVHLAVSADWKVHYYTSARDAFRAEEARFLGDMPGVLGARAMAALHAIMEVLGLDYAGVDFALGERGEVLVFEANAGMVLTPAAEAALRAARHLCA
jgi:ferredoxin